MRQIKEYETADGEKRFRVRYRLGKIETSETFRRKPDATEFAAILSAGGVDAATAWLAAREAAPTSLSLGQWFEEYVDQLTGVTERTRSDYRSMYRRYLSHLGPTPVGLVQRSHVTALVNTMDRAGRSPKTIKQTIHMLSSCMALAIDEGHASTNPCRRVRLPTQQLDADEIRFLTHEEFALLVDATPEHYRPLVVFLVGTGMRWSEATAIQARHVDLANGTARVDQAWKRVPGQGYRLGPPKSPKSRRTVNAATLALAAVKPLLRRPTDLVFVTASGGPVRHANFYNNIWQPACVKAGLGEWVKVDGKRSWRGPSPHDLRHTHASWLISDGVTLEAVQDQLGHESILTTRKTYGRLLPAVGIAAGRSASAALALALGDGPQSLALTEAVHVPDQDADPDGISADA